MSITIPAFDGLEAMTRFTLAGIRPMVMLSLLPGLGGVALPWRARAAVAASLASFTAFGPHAPALTVAMLPGEVLAGLLAGLAVALAFAAAQMAGEVAAQIIGLGFANVPGAGGNASVIGGFFGMLLWAAFLSGDGFLWLFASVVAGQGVLPPGAAGLETLAAYGAVMFAGALRMALPVVGAAAARQSAGGGGGAVGAATGGDGDRAGGAAAGVRLGAADAVRGAAGAGDDDAECGAGVAVNGGERRRKDPTSHPAAAGGGAQAGQCLAAARAGAGGGAGRGDADDDAGRALAVAGAGGVSAAGAGGGDAAAG